MNNNEQLKTKHQKLLSGKLSAEENVKHYLSQIKKGNDNLNIFLSVFEEDAIQKAKAIDKKFKTSKKSGKLFGLVFAIKAVISIKNKNINCASKTLDKYYGSYNADVIEKIEKEDGIIIGIVNCDEFASGATGENSSFGSTINPASPKRIPGGSSSGSAAAVAADMCDISLGTDTGGSIRNPASHCGITGIKPSYGRVSRYGLLDLSMSLDTIGPLSKDAYGCAITLEVIAGKTPNDPTTEKKEIPTYTKQKVKGKYKIGIIKDFNNLIIDKEIKDTFNKKIAMLKNAGHEIIEITIKNIDLAVQAYYPIVYTEFFSGTRKYDGIKYGWKIEEKAKDEVLRRIFGGSEISKSEYAGAYYKKALRVKEIIGNEFSKIFEKIDFIISPVTPKLPHKLGEKLTPVEEYAYDVFTTPANLAGICAATIPNDKIKQKNETIPIGIQILADKFKEEIIFQAMELIKGLQ